MKADIDIRLMKIIITMGLIMIIQLACVTYFQFKDNYSAAESTAEYMIIPLAIAGVCVFLVGVRTTIGLK